MQKSKSRKQKAHAAPVSKLSLIKQFPDSQKMLLSDAEASLIEFLRTFDAFGLSNLMARVTLMARSYQQNEGFETSEDLDAICMVYHFAQMVADTEVHIWQSQLDLDMVH